MSDFVHLSVHSEYSIEDSVVFLKDIASTVKSVGMSAVALTDENNLYAMLKFQNDCFEQGIKPIIGSDLKYAGARGNSRLIVLAENQTGYHNLLRLVTSASNLNGGLSGLNRDVLEALNEGLIVLSGGVGGEVGQLLLDNNVDQASDSLAWFQSTFGDRFFIELTRTGRKNEAEYINAVVQLADKLDIPLVATNDVIMKAASDFSLHDAKMCIKRGEHMDDEYSWRGRYSQLQYFKSPDEMCSLFEDLPDAIENSVEIAKRCSVEVETGVYFQRDYPNADQEQNIKVFRETVATKLDAFIEKRSKEEKDTSPEDWERAYRERAKYEVDVIEQMGYASYFLIVSDIVQWAHEEKIPVGPGRGSGAASLVAMLLGITAVDPIKHNLFFERLLNIDRKTMPDLDIDFCAQRRDQVLAHIVDRFDKDCVGLIATQNTHAAKGIIHGMARANGYSYSDVNRITQLIPIKPGITLNEAYELEPSIKTTAAANGCSELLNEAEKLEGIVSTVGVHPAGVVIAPGRLDDFVPCHIDPDTSLFVAQLDKDDVEKVGMVKYDLLSLKNLTVIQKAVDAINLNQDQGSQPFDINQIPLDDRETYQLIASAETEGVFQLESVGMRQLIRRLKPDAFEDIVALVALYRPGPLNANIDKSYALRKHGKEPVRYDHPLLVDVLEGNYGLMIYQEDVMSVARQLAGFSGGDADILREAMGKKRQEKLATLKDQFIQGCAKNSVDGKLAESVFEKMRGFSEYAFNRAHATAYAAVTYQTAYLKTHFPNEYMAAVASVDSADPNRFARIMGEAERMGIEIRRPEINQPTRDCLALADAIQLGLGGIRGLGNDEIKAIQSAREQDGEFESLFDFCTKIDTSRVSRASIERLIHVGAMDSLERENASTGFIRATLLQKVEAAYQAAVEKIERGSKAGLFGDAQESEVFIDTVDPEPLSKQEIQALEAESLGFVLSRDSTRFLFDEFRSVCTQTLRNVASVSKGMQVTIAGYIKRADVRDMPGRGEIANVTLQDQTGSVNMVVWPEEYKEFAPLIVDDKFLVVRGQMSYDRLHDEMQVSAKKIFDTTSARREWGAFVSLKFLTNAQQARLTTDSLEALKTILDSVKGSIGRPLKVVVLDDNTEIEIELGSGFKKIPVTDQLLSDLRDLFGQDTVHVEFKRSS